MSLALGGPRGKAGAGSRTGTGSGSKSGFGHLLYARGFLIGDRPAPWVPEGWTARRFGGWGVWHDPRLAYAEAAAPRRLLRRAEAPSLACLGIILDAERPEDGPDAVLERLAGALRRSEEAFEQALDTTAGRHVLLYRAGGRTHVVGDAAGTKLAYRYRREVTLVSSHAGLVVRNAREAAPQPRLHFRYGYPGLDTPWEHVHRLTPNARLRLEDGHLRRFWPDRRVAPVGVEAAAHDVARLMGGTLSHLARRFDLQISITAGLDSRVALALARARDLPASPFTYYRRDETETDALDRDFAQAYARDAGRAVRIIDVRAMPPVPAGLKDVLRRNTLRPHNPRLAWHYLTALPQDGRALHVRSNVSGIGREFYRGHGPARNLTPRHLARLYMRGQGRGAYGPAEAALVDAHFERFAQATGLLECGDKVDVRSLFLWEHRVSAWFANAVSESDAGLDTVSPYNCRRVLERLLGVPQAARRASAVHRRIIAAHAPELTRYPVNGEVLW